MSNKGLHAYLTCFAGNRREGGVQGYSGAEVMGRAGERPARRPWASAGVCLTGLRPTGSTQKQALESPVIESRPVLRKTVLLIYKLPARLVIDTDISLSPEAEEAICQQWSQSVLVNSLDGVIDPAV